ncbi:SWIM zinc finger family protein [Myxococcota bacterium]|nr:SWIM zinc finger family protein [Myxococcota bacterium]
MARRRGDFGPYVRIDERRRSADAEVERLALKGKALSPVRITGTGRTIATTFWGKAWCTNLERYSDYANRLPRGRSYVRSGAVIDLVIGPGAIDAKVRGTRTYTVHIQVAPVRAELWAAIATDCAGVIDSLVELLQGRLSKGVLERLSRPKTGLFPSPDEITLDCSCPDSASMCKHVAATLYGVGARLDERPEHLFTLRQVNQEDLVKRAGAPDLGAQRGAKGRILEGEDLSALFGLELATLDDVAPAPKPAPTLVPKVKRARTKRARSS